MHGLRGPAAQPRLVCGECLKRPPSYDHVEVPWRFAFPVDALITRFKHQARWPYGRLLGERLASSGARLRRWAAAAGPAAAGAIGPSSLAPARFQPAQMLADWLSRPLGIATDARVLDRVLDTLAQQQLDAATRRRNLRQAFAIATGADVKGRHLALVDDVLTTGATAEALARLLKRAGAERVDVYCLARTPKPGE